MTKGDTRGSDSRSHGGFDKIGVPFWGSTIRIRLYSVFGGVPRKLPRLSGAATIGMWKSPKMIQDPIPM